MSDDAVSAEPSSERYQQVRMTDAEDFRKAPQTWPTCFFSFCGLLS